ANDSHAGPGCRSPPQGRDAPFGQVVQGSGQRGLAARLRQKEPYPGRGSAVRDPPARPRSAATGLGPRQRWRSSRGLGGAGASVTLRGANVLLYAYQPRSEHHDTCRRWLERAFSGDESVGLSWLTVLAFIRISTNARIFEAPLSATEAITIVSSWLSRDVVF